MAAEVLTTTTTTSGRVTLPRAIRERRNWPVGTCLTVETTAEGVLLKRASLFPSTRVAAVFGSLAYKGSAKSIADMDAAITASVTRFRRTESPGDSGR